MGQPINPAVLEQAKKAVSADTAALRDANDGTLPSELLHLRAQGMNPVIRQIRDHVYVNTSDADVGRLEVAIDDPKAAIKITNQQVIVIDNKGEFALDLTNTSTDSSRHIDIFLPNAPTAIDMRELATPDYNKVTIRSGTADIKISENTTNTVVQTYERDKESFKGVTVIAPPAIIGKSLVVEKWGPDRQEATLTTPFVTKPKSERKFDFDIGIQFDIAPVNLRTESYNQGKTVSSGTVRVIDKDSKVADSLSHEEMNKRIVDMAKTVQSDATKKIGSPQQQR